MSRPALTICLIVCWFNILIVNGLLLISSFKFRSTLDKHATKFRIHGKPKKHIHRHPKLSWNSINLDLDKPDNTENLKLLDDNAPVQEIDIGGQMKLLWTRYCKSHNMEHMINKLSLLEALPLISNQGSVIQLADKQLATTIVDEVTVTEGELQSIWSSTRPIMLGNGGVTGGGSGLPGSAAKHEFDLATALLLLEDEYDEGLMTQSPVAAAASSDSSRAQKVSAALLPLISTALHDEDLETRILAKELATKVTAISEGLLGVGQLQQVVSAEEENEDVGAIDSAASDGEEMEEEGTPSASSGSIYDLLPEPEVVQSGLELTVTEHALRRAWDRRASTPWGLPRIEYDDAMALLLLSDDVDEAEEASLEVEPPPVPKPWEEGSEFRQRYAKLLSVDRAIRVASMREEMRAAGVALTTELAEDIEMEELREKQERAQLSQEIREQKEEEEELMFQETLADATECGAVLDNVDRVELQWRDSGFLVGDMEQVHPGDMTVNAMMYNGGSNQLPANRDPTFPDDNPNPAMLDAYAASNFIPEAWGSHPEMDKRRPWEVLGLPLGRHRKDLYTAYQELKARREQKRMEQPAAQGIAVGDHRDAAQSATEAKSHEPQAEAVSADHAIDAQEQSVTAIAEPSVSPTTEEVLTVVSEADQYLQAAESELFFRRFDTASENITIVSSVAELKPQQPAMTEDEKNNIRMERLREQHERRRERLELAKKRRENMSEGWNLTHAEVAELREKDRVAHSDWVNFETPWDPDLVQLIEEEQREEDTRFALTMEYALRMADLYLTDHKSIRMRYADRRRALQAIDDLYHCENVSNEAIPMSLTPDLHKGVRYGDEIMEMKNKVVLSTYREPVRVEYANESYALNTELRVLNMMGATREQYDWQPLQGVEYSIDPEIVKRIQPVLEFANYLVKLKSTKDNILMFDYYGPTRHVIGIRAHMSMIARETFPELVDLRLETSRRYDPGDA